MPEDNLDWPLVLWSVSQCVCACQPKWSRCGICGQCSELWWHNWLHRTETRADSRRIYALLLLLKKQQQPQKHFICSLSDCHCDVTADLTSDHCCNLYCCWVSECRPSTGEPVVYESWTKLQRTFCFIFDNLSTVMSTTSNSTLHFPFSSPLRRGRCVCSRL